MLCGRPGTQRGNLLGADRQVELRIIPTIEDVKHSGDFDFVVLAQSPNYTPASADFIIDIFKEYITEI